MKLEKIKEAIPVILILTGCAMGLLGIEDYGWLILAGILVM